MTCRSGLYVLAEQQAPEPERTEPVLPENRSVQVFLTWDTDNPTIGDTAHFNAVLTGYDGFEIILQWQISPDGINWTDIEGANSRSYDVVMTPENNHSFWRVQVKVISPMQEESSEAQQAGNGAAAETADKEPVVLKEVIEDTILEMTQENYDGDEDITVTEVAEETVVVIVVAGMDEVP